MTASSQRRGPQSAQAKRRTDTLVRVKQESITARDRRPVLKPSQIGRLSDAKPTRTTVQQRDKPKSQKQDVEKRLRQYRRGAPISFLTKLERAQTQRMIVLSRSRSGSGKELCEQIDIAGTTGNVYKVIIGRRVSCTCPDHQNGNECKHKIYVLHTVLKARYELQYQRAFLIAELEEMFANAPPIPTNTTQSDNRDGKRRPVEGECPICYTDMDEKISEVVWCKAACGNNMHKTCFDQWAASQRGKAVRCVYCRTDWQIDAGDLQNIGVQGPVGRDGYVNVAEQLGLPTTRDYSMYHQPWVRRQFAYG